MKNDNATLKMTLMWLAVGATARLLPHPANVGPLTAMALLGGAYLSRKQSLWLPLVPLFASDLILGFHATMPFVYGSFALTTLIGRTLTGRRGPVRVMAACLASSALFFVITNFGVWLTQNLYPHDASGLLACYTAAIPFFRNAALGDLAFTGILFNLETASLNWIRRRSLATA